MGTPPDPNVPREPLAAQAPSDEEVDEIDDTWVEGKVWLPEPEPYVDFVTLNNHRRSLPKIPVVTPSEFTEFAFRMPSSDGTGYENFSFEGRRHMRRIYDTPARRVQLLCARQVEKCLTLDSLILRSNGSRVEAGSVCTGEHLASLLMPAGVKMTTGEVSWVSGKIRKPCVRLHTRQGHEVCVATTHPMRTWNDWVEAGDLRVGDRLAAVRKVGEFVGVPVRQDRIRLTAYLLGDGHLGRAYRNFTSMPGLKLDEFLRDVRALGITTHIYPKKKTKALNVKLAQDDVLVRWLIEDKLFDSRSSTKFIPDWVYNLSKADTSLFLNRLWSTDGHAKRNSVSRYSIEYCSISQRLIRDVQALLWKFGIPSRIRKNWPNIYKKRGERKYAYILRIETREGVRTFIEEIGALGKSEHIQVEDRCTNNNRDTYPIGVNALIRKIIQSNPRVRRGCNAKSGSLRSAGLRETLQYPLTSGKLLTYLDFFASDVGYDWDLVEQLATHLNTDLYWDEVVRIERVGEQWCVDFEVEENHNFVVDGLVAHNSTCIGNKALCYSCIVPGFLTLYVSPTGTQTKTFSNDRLKGPIETSPVLRMFTTRMLSQNVMEKQFVNYSKIVLRNAFLNADRTRGIAAWLLAIDEFQDILGENVPVIEQCTSHAPENFKMSLFTGTPKSLDNNIEFYRSGYINGHPMSTSSEWAVPCDCTGGDQGRYWNILGEKNIGKKGLICERCGKIINPQGEEAQWAHMFEFNPENMFESYRIPQLMVPWKPWSEILLDYERYPRDKFYNEVLGISYDSGMRPLTKAQVKDCCDPNVSMLKPDKYKGENLVFAGVDWGTGEQSYTVVTLGTYVEQQFVIFYAHRMVGPELEPPLQMKLLVEMFKDFKVAIIGADYGGGFHQNDALTREFGPLRLAKFQYMGRCRRKVEWEPKLRRFRVFRTEVMSDVFNAIKRKKFTFPCWDEFQNPYASDMCNIFSEYNDTLRMIQYDHRQDRPDDTLHSILYCFLASMIKFPRPDIIAPLRDDQNVGGPMSNSYSGPYNQGDYG